MAMNFFEHQDQARRRTGRLVTYFALAVLCIVAALYATGMLLLNWAQQSVTDSSQAQAQVQPEIIYWNWEICLGVVCLSGLIIGGGSLYRIHQLSGGGSVVAESLGGTLLDPGTVRGDERKLLNIVEEMAIASGVPVPPVYVIEDDSINAFAAGSATDAVIGVTRAAWRNSTASSCRASSPMSSVTFNGDMRLNIRLIGVIYGLLVMGLIGLYVLRFAVYSGGMRRSSGNKKDNGVIVVIVIAAVMMLLGFVGTFFGRLIQLGVASAFSPMRLGSSTREIPTALPVLAAIGGLSVEQNGSAGR